MNVGATRSPALAGAVLTIVAAILLGACTSSPSSPSTISPAAVEIALRECLTANGVDIAGVQLDVDEAEEISGFIGVITNGVPDDSWSPAAVLEFCRRQLGLPDL